jgi:hypothetical protein
VGRKEKMIFTLLLFRVCAEEGIYMGTAASLRCVALSGHNRCLQTTTTTAADTAPL